MDDPHFRGLGQKTYLRCTIGKWQVDLDSEEAQEAFRLISDEGLRAFRSQPAFIRYRLMIADPTTTIAVAEWENEEPGKAGSAAIQGVANQQHSTEVVTGDLRWGGRSRFPNKRRSEYTPSRRLSE